jgi:hypothetical protein
VGNHRTFADDDHGGGGGTGGVVDSVTAANGSVVIGGTLANPTVRANLATSVPDIGPNEGVVGVALTERRGDAIPGQKIQAAWPLANTRWYALDGALGNDSFAGFSDVSSAAAGLVAKKTIAGLAAILPRVGANRKLAVVVKAGTYADSIDTLLQGLGGYASNALVVGTVTDATSGAVAFAGNAADRIQAGFVTVTGLNAGGYNPTGGPSTTTMTIQQNGGGAAALPAEPAAPLGWRIRFAATTTTVALRNICRTIVGVPTNASLSYQTLPAVPVVADIFYIEQAGVVMSAGRTVFMSMDNIAPAFASGFEAGFQMVGINLTDTLRLGSGRVRWAGCRWGGAAVAVLNGNSHDYGASYVDETGTSRTIGAGLRIENTVQWADFTNVNPLGQQTGCFVGQVSVFRGSFADLGASTYFGGGVLIDEVNMPTQATAGHAPFYSIGNISAATFPGPCRVKGAIAINAGARSGVQVCTASVALTPMTIDAVGAFPAIQLVARCVVSLNGISGTTGNLDVGLDLTLSRSSLIILPNGAPTVTGVLGNVRLSDGSIITWAQALAGVVDPAGNIIFASPNSPLKLTPTANGAVASVMTANVGAVGNNVNIQRWVKVPDGLGGFFTFPSWT